MEAFSHSLLEENSSVQNFHQLFLKGHSLASIDLIITFKVSERVLKREKIFKILFNIAVYKSQTLHCYVFKTSTLLN